MSESSFKKKAKKYLSQELLSDKTFMEDFWERFESIDFDKLLECSIIRIEDASDKSDYSTHFITKKIKAILKRMQTMLYNRICKVKTHAFDLLGYISLLFGLCASQSAFIFHSLYGSSLTRIPTSL